ncbi:hypothetical protein [Candidatus Villigracilis saccharophilus]|uniref:hypothetical protein n=1 Tax=Candidatus Villigracilis saccharophilus TaxID=3140684 RepID=UPI0031359E10|nr:hypothetical protein [Anaerolineales bacterium]
MELIKKTLAAIFAVLFIITAVAALIFFNFDRKAFTAETYQKGFANANFYDRLPAMMAETMVTTSTNQEQFPLVMRGMSTQAWDAFFRTLLPQDVLNAMADDALNSTFAYLNMQADSAQVSLTPLKTAMVSDAGVQAVLTILKTQPDCTLQQIGQMTIDLLSNSQIQFCNPPQEMTPFLTPVIQSQMQMVSLAIPDQFALISAPPANDPRQKLQDARLLMRLSPIVPLGLLLLMTLLAVNSLKSWLNWWGIPFLITGGLASLMGLSGAPVVGVVFQRILVNRMPAILPPILLDYTGELASSMVKALLNPVLLQGLVLAVIGLVMVVGAFFVKARK